jgi:hypothetical protein
MKTKISNFDDVNQFVKETIVKAGKVCTVKITVKF